MTPMWKRYVRAFKRDLDAWAVWEPGTQVELCDFGVVEGGRWSKLGSLWELVPKTEKDTVEESKPAELIFGSATISELDTQLSAPSDLASVTVRFGSTDSLFVRASKSIQSRVANLQDLSERLLKAKDKWKREWYLVTGVRRAAKFTVLSAGESNAEVKVSASVANLHSFLAGNIAADAGLRFAGNVAFSFVGRSGPIHLDLARIRIRWWSGEEALRRFGQETRVDEVIYDEVRPTEVPDDGDAT